MVSLTGGDFILGFLAGTILGGWVIGIAKDLIGGVINLGQNAVGMQGQMVGTYTAGYSGRDSEDSWT